MALRCLPFLLLLFTTASAALPDSPKSFDEIAKQAEAARSADRVRDAINLYSEGVHLRPQWSEGWWSLASLLYDQDRFPEAETAFQKFATISPKPAVAYSFLGLCEYETRDYDRALSHFRLWARAGWPGTPQSIDVSVFHFALLLTRDGEFVQALYLLATEAAKMGTSPALVEAMGLASLRMKNIPEDYAAEARERVWLAGQAAVYAAQLNPEFDRADEYADRLGAHYAQNSEVHYFRGTLFKMQQRVSDAEREYRQALEMSPKDVPAMLALAEIDLDKNELQEAEAFARKSIELAPKNPEAHHVLGRILMTNNENEASAAELEIARKLAPDSALVHSHLAIVYTKLGRSQEAKAEAATFLRLKNKEGVLAPPEERLRPDSTGKAK